jgi:enoyl-CoA hydratase/carnithine racemase
VIAFVLLALYVLQRSWAAVLVSVSPVAIGTVLTLATMSILEMRITIFTVIAIPVLIGVAVDSSIEVYRTYTDRLREPGARRPIPDVMAEVGKVVALNAFSTVLPFGALMFGEMKGLVALGTILALGVLYSFFATIIVLPCLLSVVHDWLVPATQYAVQLYPDRFAVRVARAVLGRWLHELPQPDGGMSLERVAGGIQVVTLHRPPLNLLDAAMTSRGIAVERAFLADPELSALIVRSGLPRYYHVRDAAGRLLLDGRGKPKRVAANRMDADELPPGYTREGPIRPFGGGADLAQIAKNPLEALFMMESAKEGAVVLWYAGKPMILVAEGDVVAGWFELAMYANYFLVTRHARLGAPEVKRGLTLPYGSHALQFRAGTAAAQNLMASGDLISAEEAVRLGIADAMVPDGVDPMDHALALCRAPEFHDRIRQVSMLRQYGPPLRPLVARSVRNYIRLLRSKETRARLRAFLSQDVGR